jgi:alpha-glucosidase
MRLRLILAAWAALGLGAGTACARDFTLSSPSGSLRALIRWDEAQGTLAYSVTTQSSGQVVDPSALGLLTRDSDLSRGLVYAEESRSEIRETYELPSGKVRRYRHDANELRLAFRKGAHGLELLARMADDGFALRYVVTGAAGNAVLSEATELALPTDAETWSMRYVPPHNYEEPYELARVSELAGSRRALPLLSKSASGPWVLAFEGALDGGFSGSHAVGLPGGKLGFDFAPEDRARGSVAIAPRFVSPWRAAIVARDLPALFASNWPVDLGDPAPSVDTSWIRPGRVAWSWMSGWGKESLEIGKAFVDLAAALGWEYYLLDEGWHPIWVPALAQYAQSKGVGLLLWEHQSKLDTQAEIDQLFPLWASWGIQGLKIDFFDSEDQAHLQIHDRLLAAAAEHHFLLNFHGASPKVLGQRRKWPFLLAAEGVRGEEYRIWSGSDARPAQDTTFPFTRNLLGGQDSTLVPLGYAHAESAAYLYALTVVFESGLMHFAEGPDDYLPSPARDFLAAVPAAWDESRLLDGYPGERVAIARRRGAEWFVGAISRDARVFKLRLDFLDAGRSYRLDTYREGSNRAEVVRESRQVTREDTLSLPVTPGSGVALRFHGSPN